MRTKTLLLTAVFGAAFVATSMAQPVYSVNAVGYVNLDLPVGFSLIANPLNNAGNKLTEVLPSAPDGTTLFKFIGAGFDPDAPQFVVPEPGQPGIWYSPKAGYVDTYVLAPGEGAFISLPTAAKLTFVGEVPQGDLSNPIPTGFSIRASKVPQAGKVTTDLKWAPAPDDQVFKFLRAEQRYDPVSPQWVVEGTDALWFPTEPSVEVGESFFVLRQTAGPAWTRTFSVNQ